MQSITSPAGSQPTWVVWDEAASLFYAFQQDNLAGGFKILSSPDGEGDATGLWTDTFATWVGDVTALPINTLDGSGYVWISLLSGTITEGPLATNSNPGTPHVVRAAGNFLDGVYCVDSGLWTIVGFADVGTDDGIYTSPDRVVWTPVVLAGNPLVSGFGEDVTWVCAACNQEDQVVVAMGTPNWAVGEGALLARSADGGATWARIEPVGLDWTKFNTGGKPEVIVIQALKYAGGRFIAWGTTAFTQNNFGAVNGAFILLGDSLGLNWRVVWSSSDAPVAFYGISRLSAASEYVAVNGSAFADEFLISETLGM
jgi:hypothetical protein